MNNKGYKIRQMILSQKYLGVILCFISTLALGQTNDEIRKSADDFFESEKYVEATKSYLHLLSLSPTDADLNFKYGTCLLFNSNNKNKALRYLAYAVKNPEIDPRAYFFNGKALHLDYQFEKAKQSYIQYQEKRSKKDDRYKVELAIKMCESGKKLLSSFTDIIVTNKQEIGSDNFFKIYSDSKTIGGEILVVANFQSKMDKKMNHVPVVHFPPKAKAIYYSSYGEDGSNGLDIYIRRKLPDGTWGDPQPLPGSVNTSENEDFPYLHPSGNFLYFSSTGHNSMGGYDVFMSRLDTETNSFFTPENVDFAICSPDDDLFYVVDSLFQNAYFASSRQSEDGKYHVYNVKVTRVPIQEIIVMGNFSSEINPNNETMRITLTSVANGSEVGKVVSNDKGKYSFVFPKGGKYNFEITVDGNESITYKYIVDLPFLDEFRPLKQKAIHKLVDGQEIVTIINLFDEEVEGAEAMIAEVIRQKAVLDVNVDKFDLKELEKADAKNKVLAEIGFNNMSIQEISSQLSDLAKGEEKRSEMIERIETNLDLAVIAQSEELTKLNAELKVVLAKVDNTSDPVEKHSLLMQAKKMESAINDINSEITLFTKMKNEVIQKVGAPSTSGVGKIKVIENQFNSLISSGKEDDAIALLVKNKDALQKAKTESVENYIADLVSKSLKLNDELKVLKKQQVDLELNQNSVEAQLNQLNSQLIAAKKKEIDQIKSQIADKQGELEMVKQALVNNKKRIIEKNSELDVLNNSIETLQKAVSNTDLAAYNKSEVEVAIKKAKNIEEEVVSNQIENQIIEIERVNPQLNVDYQAPEQVENSLAQIQKELNEKINELETSSNFSIDEKFEQELLRNNESIADANRRINAIERELETNPNNKVLIEEKSGLVEHINELEKKNVQLAEKLKSLDVVVTNSNQLNDIQSSIEANIAEINSNGSTTEKEKIELKQQVVKENITAVDNRLNEVKKELQLNPNNTSLQKEQSDLNLYKSELESKSTELSNELVATNSEPSIDDLVVIQNNLNQKIESIRGNQSLSAQDKLKAEKEANIDGLASIEKRLIEIDEQLKIDSRNVSLKNEKEALKEFQTEVKAETVRLDMEVVKLNNTSVQTNQLQSIQASLSDKIQAINSNTSTTEQEKVNLQQQAKNESIIQIDKRLNVINAAFSNDPNNSTLKEERSQLEEYRSELQSINSVLTTENSALNKGNTTQVTELASIQFSLSNKTQAIKSNTSITEEQKLNLQQEANNESIAQINKRINDIEALLSNEPDNTDLLEEQLSLIQYKSTLEQENAKLTESLIALNPVVSNESELTKEAVLKAVQADYQENVNSINSNSELSEVDKLKQLQTLDESLIVALQKETTLNDKALSKRTEDKVLIDKKEVLDDLIVQKQNEVEERTQIINAKTNVSSVVDVESVKTEILTAVNSNYESEKNTINSSNSTDYEKLEAFLQLEVGQLTKLENKKAEIEKTLKRNPSDEKVKLEKEAIDVLISDQKARIETLKTTVDGSISAEVIEEKVNALDNSYYSDIATIEKESSSTKNDEIKAREVELQKNLEAAIVSKEKALSRNYSVTVELEKAIFEKALVESKERAVNAENSIPSVNDKSTFISEVRSSNNQEIQNTLSSNPTTKMELEKADAVLATYESDLIQRIETIENELKTAPTNQLKEQKEWLENELEEVQKKRRQFSVSIGELETELISNNSNSSIEKLKTELLESKNENTESTEALKNALDTSPSNKTLILASEFNLEKQAEIEAMIIAAEKEESSQEKEKQLIEVSLIQKELNSTLKEVLAENNIKVVENETGSSLLTENEVNEMKRNFSVGIGELTTEIEKADAELETATGDDKIQVQQKKENLIREKSLLELRLEELIRNRENQTTEIESVIDIDIKNKIVSQADKTEIASSDQYEKYYTSATKAIELENDLTAKNNALNDSKSELVKMIESGASISSKEVKDLQSKIKTSETSVKETEKQFNQAKTVANNQLPSNSDEASKLKALVAQGTEPEKTNVSVDNTTANNNTSNTSTNITNTTNNTNQTNDNSNFVTHTKGNEIKKSTIPVGNETSTGLVFRVQVGAYSKPIPSTLFAEFDPVTGELISGSSVTRYMAGYFMNSNAAYKAQSKIRGFGYSDAFVVAYCNGERISIGEAKRRQSQGTCVANGETIFKTEGVEQQFEKNESFQNSTLENKQNSTLNQQGTNVNSSNKTQQNENTNTETKVQNTSVSNEVYTPIESMEGLFFTVQIGVYVGYVDASHLHGMNEVINLKLPDGQVRYSSGTFSSVDDAKPRRSLALNNGVNGAFITAYYKGERISVSEAKRLLAANGNSILQSEIEKNRKNVSASSTIEVEEEIIEEIVKNKVQFVSFNQYESFPSEVISRYNKQGFFYYDTTDNHVKSSLYKSDGAIPVFLEYKNELEEVVLEVLSDDEQVIVVKVNTTILPGDFMDWLMKQSFQREFNLYDDRIEIYLTGIELSDILKVQEECRTFVVEAELKNASDLEIEN